ncbi:MAG: hypothetical protein DMD42_00750 [Gemmatimonadetes bacterium]|nr:MAG: hypothetical protein DMD42_00750 [Gemmatimonadota bacterium]
MLQLSPLPTPPHDRSDQVESIHCIECGGYVANTRWLEYRTRTGRPEAARPHDRPCTCAKPTLYMPHRRASAPQRVPRGDASGV